MSESQLTPPRPLPSADSTAASGPRPPPAAVQRRGPSRSPRPPHLSPLALCGRAGSHRSGPAWRSASAVAAAAARPRSATCGGGENRQTGAGERGRGPRAGEPPAADSWAAPAGELGGRAACRAPGPLLLAVRASPPPTPHPAPRAAAGAAGGWARRSPETLSSPVEAAMASAARPGLPSCSPEPLLEAANWALAGAGAAGRAGRGG